ncbi:MAG TPA: ABC transporter permease [Ktedonobacteraceae bacterium]|nr:ABC transporter permease [Ktedonobacteraceae bacterium]
MSSIKAKSPLVYDSSARRIPLVYEFNELIRYRFLLWSLIVKDLKVRYKRSSIGFIWVMLNPLLTMAVLTIVFSQVFRFNVDHYSAYLLGGTLLWNLYAQGSNAAMSSLQGNGSILRKLYVPPSIFVVSAVGSALVNLVFALVPFLILTLFNGVMPSFSWLFLIVPVLLTTLFSLGIGLIVGALVIFFTDTFEIYQVLVTAYYFLTPIFYPATILPEPLRTIEQFNPMYLFIALFRETVLQGTLPTLGLLLPAFATSIVVLLIGWIVFTRVEDRFVYHF